MFYLCCAVFKQVSKEISENCAVAAQHGDDATDEESADSAEGGSDEDDDGSDSDVTKADDSKLKFHRPRNESPNSRKVLLLFVDVRSKLSIFWIVSSAFQARKQQIKDEQREKRKDKIPKHVKKRKEKVAKSKKKQARNL